MMAGAVRSSRTSNSGRASRPCGFLSDEPVFLEGERRKKRGMSVTAKASLPCGDQTACRSSVARPYPSYNRHELPSPSKNVWTRLDLTDETKDCCKINYLLSTLWLRCRWSRASALDPEGRSTGYALHPAASSPVLP